ncbi:replicative DNA helicase [Streptomyces aurantiacus]|uniref:Replicative DNA helicase n=1 Tax=Streptomyces aurantiacus JA 4570 TaxID=1286094 RepID=S3ZTT1_9ACTN|nr:replicative DNA helicase [Streptomyces aurantiacus]EPH46856.1 putative Replicative DNA helicase [Streptomyces aurantiacus JA 4570]
MSSVAPSAAPGPGPSEDVPETFLPGLRQRASPEFERVPPQDLDAEQSVLGGMILSKRAIDEVINVLAADDFYRPAHQTIFRAIVRMRASSEPVDPITLAAELSRTRELQKVGGPTYLHALVQTVPTAANAEHYAEIIRERAVLRRLVEAGTRVVQMGYEGTGSLDEITAGAAAEIMAVTEGRDREDDFRTPRDSLGSTLDLIQAAESGTGMTGVPTGFVDLDSLTNGFQPGQVIVVAARPGMGKSTLAMDFARACTMPRGKNQQPDAARPAAFITLEMSIDELNMRCLSAEGKVALHHLRSGTLDEAGWEKLAGAVQVYNDAPLYINESARSLPEIQAKCRRLKTRLPDLALIVIDYLQLITAGGRRRAEVREQEVADISRSLKLLAKELHLPIVVLSQLNRGPEMRQDKKPQVSDLRESGSVEQDADMVILLYRDDAYEKESPRAGEADLIVGKHRNGPTATITVASQLHYSRFVDMAQT